MTIMHEDLLARVSRKETQVRPVTKTILGANITPLNVTGSAKVDISVSAWYYSSSRSSNLQ